MAIKKRKISDLKFDDRNINKGSEFGQSLLEKSMRETGLGRSILTDKNNVIIAGNQTAQKASELGFEEIIEVETNGKQLVVVKRTDLDITTEAGIKMKILDNTVSKHNYVEDAEVTEAICEEIKIEPVSYGLTASKQEAAEDDYEIPDEIEADIVLGDLFEIGEHRLLCGDSTDSDSASRLMNGQKADMVFTDPPYGMFLNADFSDMDSKFKGSSGGNKYEQVKGDNQDFKPELISTVFENFNYCKEIFLWGADYYADLLEDKNGGSWVVWDKRLDESADKMYGSCFELCWSKAKHKRMIARVKWAGIFGMEKEQGKKRLHPTQKPVLLVNWFFDYYSLKDKTIVADLYLGSGTTMVASHQLNRKCYGMEIDAKYCEVIVQRMKKLDPSLIIKRNGKPWE